MLVAVIVLPFRPVAIRRKVVELLVARARSMADRSLVELGERLLSYLVRDRGFSQRRASRSRCTSTTS